MERRRGWLVCAALAMGGLAGCGDAVTVHSMASALDSTPEVPALAGRWIATTDHGVGTLQIDGDPENRGRCRGLTVRYHEGSDDVLVGHHVCFFELDGHLVAEFAIGEPNEFYRQFLVRISDERIETCGMWPVWVMLDGLSKDRATGYSLDALQYTEREEHDTSLLVFISKAKALRDFLELALPELASACDSGGEDFEWIAFERAPAEEAEVDAEGAE